MALKRMRSGGWSPDTQRAFIHELTRIGTVGAAARAVGKSSRSAYQLRDKPGAEGFAAAWELAKQSGQEHVQQVAIERALHGEVMPQFRNGRFIGYKMVHNDKMLIAALGSWKNNGDFQRPALAEWHRRLEKWEAALRREAMDLGDGTAATQKVADEAWQDHVVWQREMKAEARRQRNAEIRLKVRKAAVIADARRSGPRITLL